MCLLLFAAQGCWNLMVNYTFVKTSGDGRRASIRESRISTKLTITSEASPSPSNNPSTNAASSTIQHTEIFFIVVLLIFGIVCIFGIVTLTLVFWKWRTKHPAAPTPVYNARVIRQSTTKTCVTPLGKMEAAVTVEMTEISCSSSRSDHLHSALDLVGEGRAKTRQTDDRVTEVKFCSLPQLCPEQDSTGMADSSSPRCKRKEYTVAMSRILPIERQLQEQDLTEHIERTLAASAPSPAQSNLAIIQTDL